MVAQPIGPQRDDPWTLFVDQELLLRSSHAKTKCVECHPGAMDLPHPSIQARPTCSTSDCHAAEGPLYARSVHAKGGTVEDEEFPECWTCHGFHDVLPASQRGSRTYPLNVLGLCGGCHEQHSHTAFRSESDLPEHGATLVQYFRESEHGRSVLSSGLVVAATCPDCHRAHDIQPSHEPTSSVSKFQVPHTCGRCHVGIVEKYDDSIHSVIKHDDEQRDRIPVCTSCHTNRIGLRAPGRPTLPSTS